MRAETAAILTAQRSRRQRQQDFFANQRAEIDLTALVQRELQVFGAKIVVVVSNRLGRQHNPKRTVAGRVEILGTSRAHGAGPGLEHASEKQFRPRTIERYRHFDRSLEAIFADRYLVQAPVDFILRLDL